MRMRIYHNLVNKHLGICQRYHKVHDNVKGPVGVVLSWVYLLLLNFAYTFLFCRFLGNAMDTPVYEEKNLPIGESESECRESPEAVVERLKKYDVISFDIFDTLIYRPFSSPTDLFYLAGAELEYIDFARIRAEAEHEARLKKYAESGTYEVTLEEIWKTAEEKTGIDAREGMVVEIKLEKNFCYANPYMLEVYRRLKELNKKIVYISDMYLPGEVLTGILLNSGYEREQLYLSCETGKSKAKGDLFEHVLNTLGTDCKVVHIGDNEDSDIKKAEEAGFDTYPAVNPNKKSHKYRAYDLSPVIGGAYRGIVNNRIYNGLHEYSKYYEYGFIYGGLFVLGYCHFIHDYCDKNSINKILFLSRDGKIVKDVYDRMYSESKTEYVRISRMAACKITAAYSKYDYIKKFVLHKVNKGHTLEAILKAMELEELTGKLDEDGTLKKTDKLTGSNSKKIVEFLDEHWSEVLEIYKPQREAARVYFSSYICDGDKVAVIDIGWAGTGAADIRTLAQKDWNVDAEVVGILAGTNTPYNAEPYMSESYLLSGKMVSYMYSSAENRDLWKKHNPTAGYNLYFELITSSDEPSFKGYYLDGDNGIKLEFLEEEENPEGIKEIQRGIIDFAEDYIKHFKKYPYMFNISGRDAYAPMLVAASYDEKYLKDIYKDFELKLEVGA